MYSRTELLAEKKNAERLLQKHEKKRFGTDVRNLRTIIERIDQALQLDHDATVLRMLASARKGAQAELVV